MVRRVAFLHCDKGSTTSVANFSAGDELRFDSRAVIGGFDDAGFQCDNPVNWGGPQKLDVKIGGHRARCLIFTSLFHQVISGRPV